MRKIILFIMAILMIAVPAQGADPVKLSAFTTGTTVADTDYLLYLYYSGGQYYNRKITMANLKSVLQPHDAELAALAGLASAANAIPYFTGAGTASVISSSANMVSLLGSADYDTARTNLGLAIGTNVQAYSDILAGIAGVTPANNGIFGYNNSGTLGLYTNHSHDDSAAHIYDATTTTNTVKIDAPTDTDGSIDVVLDFSAVADSDKTFTFPNATGTVALVTNHKIASFAWDGGGTAVATANSKRCVVVPAVSTVTGYTMIVDQDPGEGGTILNLDKDAIGDGTALPTTDMDGSSHAGAPTVPDNTLIVDGSISGWTTSVSAKDVICATVATNAVSTWITLTIYGKN